jgi:hypothetical protein
MIHSQVNERSDSSPLTAFDTSFDEAISPLKTKPTAKYNIFDVSFSQNSLSIALHYL